jgi:hypothetical protein
MSTDFRRLVAAFTVVATIAALYYGAKSVNADIARAFLAVLIITLLIAFTPRIYHGVLRIIEYPRLIGRIANLESQLASTQADYAVLVNQSSTAFQRGVMQGEAKVRGLLQSMALNRIPSLTGLTYDGEVLLVGTLDPDSNISSGVWLYLEEAATQKVRGVVAVTLVDKDNGHVYLSCVEATMPEYWERLKDEVFIDPGPPRGVRLARASWDRLNERFSTSQHENETTDAGSGGGGE